MSEAELVVPSFAKINWSLKVLGRREDGMHEVLTVFQTITLHDLLSFSTRRGARLTLTCNAPDIPVDESNLVLRAGRALQEKFNCKSGADIHLEKRIPAQGGLGGGSSNAAVALLALSRLWKINITKEELIEIGSSLGADVPFFFTGGTALGKGLGTEVRALEESPRLHLLIVAPESKVSTARAYKLLNAPALTKGVGDAIFSISRGDANLACSPPYGLDNDFERVVLGPHPEIERAKRAVLGAGALGALLAGSG
ncbi:MAG TPA: 4-(cytidine 5'-diphospho)-2-C-methyl-D-erythritol kinase, partial [Pyrinomonadaceae bacterium]